MRLLLIFLCVLGLTHGYTNKTIVECLRDNGFSVLPKLINDAGLTATLSTAGRLMDGWMDGWLAG